MYYIPVMKVAVMCGPSLSHSLFFLFRVIKFVLGLFFALIHCIHTVSQYCSFLFNILCTLYNLDTLIDVPCTLYGSFAPSYGEQSPPTFLLLMHTFAFLKIIFMQHTFTSKCMWICTCTRVSMYCMYVHVCTFYCI